jgi:hypothetical protein
MIDTLLDAVFRYTGDDADAAGIAQTPISGVTVLRSSAPGELQYAISRPIVALVVQGVKRVTAEGRVLTFGAGESLLITADVPTVSQVINATADVPYLSLVCDLDPAVLAELTLEMKLAPLAGGAPVTVEPTDKAVAEVALRLMKLLLERPAAVPVLQAQMMRELHYWLLTGRHGAAIRQLGYPDSRTQRIARRGGAAGRIRA